MLRRDAPAARCFPHMLALNQILHQRYRITAQLGQIDSGLGYTAFDTVPGINVFLKETLCENGEPPTPAVPATVRHQSLLCAGDTFAESGRQYVVMEHIDGKTLGDLIERRKNAFPIKDVALWADGLLDALNHLHTHNPPIIHSDIKPHNIKLSVGGNVRLLLFEAGSARDQTSRAELTTFDAAVLGYLPLEQIWLGLDVGSRKVIRSGYDERSAEILEKPLDVQSDLYAIGATLYHLLTARVPADSLTRSIELLEGNPDPLVAASEINPAIPVEVSDLLTRALQIKREERFGSASIMRQVLRSAIARSGSGLTDPSDAFFQDDDAVLELPARMPASSALATSTRPGMRSAESRQLEMIKRQLGEAETRRLEAEKRASEAEQRLLERDTVEFRLADVPIEIIEIEDPVPAPVLHEPVPESGDNSFESVGDPDPFSYGAEREGGSPLAKAAGAAVVLVAAVAAVWGVWSYTSGATAEVSAPKQDQPSVVTVPEISERPTEAVATTSVVSDPAPSDVTASEPDTAETQPTMAKPTPVPVQQAKKQSAPMPKTSQPQKKSVTLDDLLKDN